MKSIIKAIKGAALAGALLSFLATSAQEASFTFSPASVEVYEGESFETQVLIETGNVPFTVFDLHLAFDTEYLQVMGIEVEETNNFNYHMPAEFSNESGRVDAAAFKTTPETTAELMLVATITFVAVSPTELTEVDHLSGTFPRSIIAYGGEDVTGNKGGLDVTITGNALSNDDRDEENGTFSVWPNPAGDLTNLSFALKESNQTSLKLYSAEGKLVKTIFEGNTQVGIPYQFEINVSDLAQGNYTARLVSGDASFSKKLTVTR